MPDDHDSVSSTTVDDGPDVADGDVGRSGPDDSIFDGDSDEYEFAFEVGSDEADSGADPGPATSSVSVYADGWADDEAEYDPDGTADADDVYYDDGGADPYDDSLQVAGDAGVQRMAPPARLSRREKRRRVKLQARRVRRVIRHVEPWSVFKISVFFYVCLWFVFLVAGLILWSFATSSGTVENLENLIEELFALDSFTFDSDQIFRGFALAGVVLMIGGTIFNVMVCVLFNLLSDLTGGLRITMIEEESIRPMPPPRPQRRRRPPRNARRRRR